MSDSLFSELKRRNVFKVGIAYGIVAWLLIQIVTSISDPLNLPEWAATLIIVLLAVCFPVALIFAWAFEMTPDGVKHTSEIKPVPAPQKTKEVAATAGSNASAQTGLIQKLQVGQWFVVVALLLTIGYFVNWLSTMQTDEQAIIAPAQNSASIAVLPFINMSSDPEQRYFSDGISEEILNVLAQVPSLQVTSRSSAFQFRGKDIDIPTVAATLGVANVLEGSVRKAGTRVRITAQLIDAASDSHLWSHTYERELNDIFVIQDEIAGAIAAALQVELIGEGAIQPAVPRTASIDAYNLYLLGRYHFEKRTVFELEQAESYFEGAIKRDPNYAPAYSGLVDSILLQSEGVYGAVPIEQSIARALPLIQKALQLNPHLAETHASLGLLRMFERDLLASEAALKRAIELSTNFSRAYLWLYVTYDQAVKPRDAFETLQRVFILDPLSLIVNSNMAAELWIRGRTDEALRAAGRVTQVDPESPLGTRRSGRIMWTSGQLAEAVGWYRKSREVAPEDRNSKIELGALLVDLGAYGEAETLLGDQRYIVYLAQGRIEDALAVVRASLEKRPDHLGTIFAAAHVEGRAGNFERVRQLLEPLTAGAESGEGPLFRHSGIHHWDPQVAAMDLAAARLQTDREQAGLALLSEISDYFAFLKSEGLENPMLRFQEARILALEGREDEAITALRLAIAAGWRFWYIDGDPAFKELQQNRDFRSLVSDMKMLVVQEQAKLENG